MTSSFRHVIKFWVLLTSVAVTVATVSGDVVSSGASLREILTNCKSDEERERLIREWREMPPREFFYGKVVDTQGAPVPNATVDVSWYTVSLLKVLSRAAQEDSLTTDKEGRFKKRCERAIRFFAKAAKDGYEEVLADDPGNFVDHPWHSEQSPVIITMRKKGPLTFLIESPGNDRLPEQVLRVIGMNRACRPLDLLAWDSGIRDGWRNSSTTNADLRIDATFDADRKCWNVTYSVTNGPGGVVLSDSMLSEAPVDGYAPLVSVTVTNEYDRRRYLYVKSRTPALYSRVLFEHSASIGENPSLRVACKAWTNPYGERSLEADERVTENNWRTRKDLNEEAIQAIRSGRLPPKPDIGRRIRETEEKVAREEAVKERRHQEWLEEMEKLKASEKAK